MEHKPRWPNGCRHAMQSYVGTVKAGGDVADVYVYEKLSGERAACLRVGESLPDYYSFPKVDTLFMVSHSVPLYQEACKLIASAFPEYGYLLEL